MTRARGGGADAELGSAREGAQLRAWLVALVGVAVGACGGAGGGPPSPSLSPTEAPPASSAAGASSSAVQWVAARAATAGALLEAPAQVVQPAGERAVVAAPLPARITQVFVQPGVRVAARAPVVEVALPEVAAAAAGYLARDGEIAAYDRRAAQLAQLRGEGLVRAGDVSAVEVELARLRGERAIHAGTLRAAGFSPGDAAALAASGGRTVLRAPIAGVVISVDAVLGAHRTPEQPLADIAGGASVRVEARLPRALPEGATVEFVAIGEPAIAARLVTTAPTRESDGATRAWFELATPAAPGALGRIRGTIAEAHAVALPATAIGRAPTGTFVWRRAPHAGAAASNVVPAPSASGAGGAPRATGVDAMQQPVRVLAASGADVLVEGLAVGDEVAADASHAGTP